MKSFIVINDKKKFKEKYQGEINFITRSGESDIIALDNINSTLTGAWCNKQKVSKTNGVVHYKTCSKTDKKCHHKSHS